MVFAEKNDFNWLNMNLGLVFKKAKKKQLNDLIIYSQNLN